MSGNIGNASMGPAAVVSVSGRGFTPEELAQGALDRIVSVGDQSHPLVREQAREFRDQVYAELVRYGTQCVQSYKTTVSAELAKAGYPELASLVR